LRKRHRTPSGRSMKSGANVAVIVLNWRNWTDTIECLESIRKTAGVPYKIVLCDNCSQDESIAKVMAWAEGTEAANTSGGPWAVMDHRGEAARSVCRAAVVQPDSSEPWPEDCDLAIIANRKNLGFAGGNNVGLAYAIRNRSFTHFFLLNNDTVIRPDTVGNLLKRMDMAPSIGICGARIMDYHDPGRLQAAGGATYDRNRATGCNISDASLERDAVEQKMDYVCGAAMMVTRRFIEEIGLMSEDYFLYFEELDWALRAKGRFALGYADDSVLYHKEGGTIGSKRVERASDLSLFYLTRNRLLFTRKHCAGSFLPVVLRLMFECMVHAKRRDYRAFRIVMRSVVHDLVHSPEQTKMCPDPETPGLLGQQL